MSQRNSVQVVVHEQGSRGGPGETMAGRWTGQAFDSAGPW